MNENGTPVVTLPPRNIDTQPRPLYPIAEKATDPFAVAALVFGLLGCVPVFGFILAPIGVALGIFARVRISKRGNEKGLGMAMVGIELGILSFIGMSLFYSGMDINATLTAYRVRTARSEIASNISAIESYKRALGDNPVSLDAVRVAGFSVVLIDPFLRPYLYEVSNDGYFLKSAGPDRIFDTSDDIF